MMAITGNTRQARPSATPGYSVPACACQSIPAPSTPGWPYPRYPLSATPLRTPLTQCRNLEPARASLRRPGLVVPIPGRPAQRRAHHTQSARLSFLQPRQSLAASWSHQTRFLIPHTPLQPPQRPSEPPSERDRAIPPWTPFRVPRKGPTPLTSTTSAQQSNRTFCTKRIHLRDPFDNLEKML